MNMEKLFDYFPRIKITQETQSAGLTKSTGHGTPRLGRKAGGPAAPAVSQKDPFDLCAVPQGYPEFNGPIGIRQPGRNLAGIEHKPGIQFLL